MVNNEAIIAELGKHPYTPEDKITFGGASHYCKVFKLGSGKIEIVYKSGNAGAICEAMSTTECIDKNGIIVDGTDVYVLKETSPRGTFARYVVLETNTGKQLKGVVDASSISLTKSQGLVVSDAIPITASGSILQVGTDYKLEQFVLNQSRDIRSGANGKLCRSNYRVGGTGFEDSSATQHTTSSWAKFEIAKTAHVVNNWAHTFTCFGHIHTKLRYGTSVIINITYDVDLKSDEGHTAFIQPRHNQINIVSAPSNNWAWSENGIIRNNGTSLSQNQNTIDISKVFRFNVASKYNATDNTDSIYLIVETRPFETGAKSRGASLFLTNILSDDAIKLDGGYTGTRLTNEELVNGEPDWSKFNWYLRDKDGYVKYWTSVQSPTFENQVLVADANGVWNAVSGNPRCNVKGVAHRGYSSIAPENTIPAYIEASKHGFKYVECDVSETSDGEIVLLHDNTIDRTSTGTGSINTMTLETARTYDFGSWKNAKYAGTTIPTLEEFLQCCLRCGLHPYIELKTGTTDDGIAKAVNLVKGYLGYEATFISFSAPLLNKVSAIDNKIRCGFVVSSVNSSIINTWTNMTSTNKFIDSNTYTDAEITLCKNAGAPLEVWTIDADGTINALPYYISGVTSNCKLADFMLKENSPNPQKTT